ncbi:hypothetical protein EIP86_011609 [Pleurotus ostreatoroseus]|nr:hypothetical protein EIP86_011609 [Pleurotus ostreatoroseus]
MQAEERYGRGGYHYIGNGTYEPLYGQPGTVPPAQAPVNYGATGSNYVPTSAQVMFYDPSLHLPPSPCAMAHSPPSWGDVEDLAKLQLDYPTSTQDPQVLHALALELEKHLRLYQYDTNFLVTPYVNNGYGSATCLEDGCLGAEIPLVARVEAPNGGRDIGLGSLSAYRRHIANDAAHVHSRNARINRSENLAPNSLVTSHSTTRAPSTQHNGPQSFHSTARPLTTRFTNGGRFVKTEPTEPDIPQKRSLYNSFTGQINSETDTPGFATPNSKRVKVERPQTPLTPLNREPSTTSVPRASANAAQSNADITRERLGEVQSLIMSVESKLYKAEGKVAKSKADHTRITKLREELEQLQTLKEIYNASLPSMKPISRTGSGEARFSLSPAKPSTFAKNSVPLPPPFQNPAYTSGVMVSHPAINNANANNLPPHYVHPGRVASGSNIKLEAAPADPHFYAEDPAYGQLAAGVPGFTSYNANDERFDSDGDFYGRGKDTFAGPIAKADDIDKFLIAAGNTEQFDGNANVDKALQKLGLQTIYQPLAGMEVALMPHQAIGVAWMLEKERGAMKGGCLADEMGLGKTVQMIATIVSNRSTDPLKRTTLIVSPLALLDQWQQEIELKTNLGFKCLLYHGSTKVRRPEELRRYDIVLTTYQTLSFEWPDSEAEERKKKRKKKNPDAFIIDDDDDNHVKTRGRKTRVSRAVTKLDATYRWCLTGTPIINGLGDAYAPIRFLRIRPFYDWNEFNQRVTLREKKNPGLATQRLQAIFATMLLRRKKDSMLDGKRLIELPNKQIHLVKLQFSQEEREVYQMVCILPQLIRSLSRPEPLPFSGAAFVNPGETEENSTNHTELSRAQRSMGIDFVLRMKEKFKRLAQERMQAEKSPDSTPEGEDYECPICFDSYTDAVVTVCGHTFCRECIMNVLNGVQREDAQENNHYKPEERPCPACRGAITKDKLFLRTAFEPTDAELQDNAEGGLVLQRGEDGAVEMTFIHEQPQARKGRATRKKKARRSVVGSEDEEDDGDDDLSDFIVEDDEDEEEAEARIREKKRLRSKGKGKARAIIVSDDEEDADVICGARPDHVNLPPEKVKLMPKFLPSTKMKHMMENLRKWAEEHPDEKTLIISQWTSCLQLVSDYLAENGFLHVKYQGDMNRSKRDQAVRVFMAKDKAMIMLMSMKCGGVGLNLTRANRVISLDLGWSEAVEAQAFDRVHRLGQSREVSVHRLVIAGTVEDRILALQDRKKLLADCSLGEGTAKKLGKLTVKELANLFGLDVRGHLLQT